MKRIEVLLVDDSATSRMLLQSMLESDPELLVIASARDGLEAVACVRHRQPDVIIMDITMPRMDGYEATQQILQLYPIPIIICSGAWKSPEAVQSFRAIEVGAVTAIAKPEGPDSPNYAATAASIARLVKAMAGVKVVRRLRRGMNGANAIETGEQRLPDRVDLLAMGASTGGPPVLKEIFTTMKQLPTFPIVVVQHIAPGFLDGMVSWLQAVVPWTIRVAEQGETLLPGHIYFAPDQSHIGLREQRVILDQQTPAEYGLRPTVDYLFQSMARHYGSRAVGILLTGMGSDGARGLLQMRNSGALTVAQDQKSSLIFGMPGEAVHSGAAQKVLNPPQIADLLDRLSMQSNRR
ncbi:MAG: chemotaxis-specific protein-glutamate methyltransferase CheB [Magnetococcales bacterium]|nr:chemotaxis-specific protein-glutamate methyltransferase CheB [Magnetococcales bacterium]